MRELIGKADLKERYKLKTKRSVMNRVKAGTLPAPFYIGTIPYWYLDEIEETERNAPKEPKAI